VTPNSGAQGASIASLAIVGTNTHFAQGTSVLTFSGTGITVNTLTVTDATHATANISITGAAATTARDVTVTTSSEVATLTAGFTVVGATPTVTSVSPSQGVLAGGTPVTITGTNFTGATAVTFGGSAATSVVVVNSTTITCATPSAAAGGPVSVIVTTPSGANTANNLYAYVQVPVVLAVDGTVTNATNTALTVTFGTTPISAGTLTAVVTTNSVSSGSAVQVATVIPVVTSSTASIQTTDTTVTINGFGFDASNLNNSVALNLGATVSSITSTPTQIVVTFGTKPTVGNLTAVVTSNSQSSGTAVQVATVSTLTITSSTANLVQSSTTLTIAGTGFSTTLGSNTVTFNNGAVGHVTGATTTSLTVTFDTKATSLGALNATVSVTGVGSTGPTQVATVVAGAAAKLAVITQPSNTASGTAISPSVTVQIQDANGFLTTNTSSVTMAIGTNPSSGTLSGTLTVAAVAGTATFSTLNIDKVGTGYTLSATSGGLTDSFNLNGVLPPLAPYAGTFLGPGPLLGDTPTRTTGTTTASISGNRNLDVSLYVSTFGTYLALPVTKKLDVMLEGGGVLAIASGSYTYESTVTVPGVGTQVSHGGKNSTRLLPGVFSSVGLAWHLTDQFSLQTSVRYQFMRQFSLMANGSHANLSFDSALVLSIGAMYRF